MSHVEDLFKCILAICIFYLSVSFWLFFVCMCVWASTDYILCSPPFSTNGNSVMSDSLWPHGLQHARLPCPSLCPRICSNSYPLSQWCHPIISSSVAPFSSCPVFPNFRVFSNESALCIRWAKDWSFSFSISPSTEYSELIFFRIDWFDLYAVQRTLKGLLQHHSSKASIHMLLIIYEIESESPSVVSNSLGSHGLYSPWNSPGQNTGVGSLSLLPGESSQPRDRTQVSRIGGGFFTNWATREAHEHTKPICKYIQHLYIIVKNWMQLRCAFSCDWKNKQTMV